MLSEDVAEALYNLCWYRIAVGVPGGAHVVTYARYALWTPANTKNKVTSIQANKMSASYVKSKSIQICINTKSTFYGDN